MQPLLWFSHSDERRKLPSSIGTREVFAEKFGLLGDKVLEKSCSERSDIWYLRHLSLYCWCYKYLTPPGSEEMATEVVQTKS